MVKHIAALVVIFLASTFAWMILGATIFHRTYASDSNLRGQVASIWGGPLEQRPPTLCGKAGACLGLERTRIDTRLDLEHRQKGLLWYSTYRVAFRGDYTFHNRTGNDLEVSVLFPLPAEKAVYDGLTLQIDGQPVAISVNGKSAFARTTVPVPANTAVVLSAAFRSQGLDRWRYNFGDGISGVQDFELQMTTNFGAIDFSEDALAPTTKRQTGNGWNLSWKYARLVSGFNISVEMPAKLQPGQLAGEISYFAPVSLFFFFFLMLMITTLRGIDLHPMNYFFLAASFFAFHLLLAYLADHVDIHLAFAICSVVSIGLVVSYLRIVVSPKFALREAAGAQFAYLVLFSYAFFLEGFTGLAVTIGAVLTLFIVMQMTARVRWSDRFKLSRPPVPQGS